MLQQIKKRNSGFTIIETLIVLAIAGLIIVIVLLAVPALNRASHNTNLKNDATTVASQISDFESNNDGAVPDTIKNSAATPDEVVVSLSTAPNDIPSKASVQASDSITTGTVTTGKGGSGIPIMGSGTGAYAVTNGQIVAFPGYECENDVITANTEDVAIVYAVQSASGTYSACLSS